MTECKIPSIMFLRVHFNLDPLASSSASDTDEIQIDSEPEASTSAEAPVRRGKIAFITPQLVAEIDKCKISDEAAIEIITAVAEGFGHDTSKLIINRTALQNARTLNREAKRLTKFQKKK